MTSANPPYPYYYEIPFNPSFFTSDTGGLSQETANTLYLRKTVADTATAQETFSLGIKAQKVDGLLSSSIMYVGNNITSGSLLLGNTGIRTKNQGIFETASIRTPATTGQLTICTDLTTGGSVEIGSVNGTVNLLGSASGGVNVPTSGGVSTNAVNVSYLNTALVNVATLNQVQTFNQTNTFDNATAGIKANVIAGVATTGTQSLYATKTAGALNIATSQTSGNINIGANGSVTYIAGISRLGGTSGGAYVSGNEPDLENGKHMTMMTGASTKIIWYYNWSMWAENGGSMYFYYGGSPESATSGIAAARISGAGAFITISDISKKQDIKDLTYGLDAIHKLRPVSFSYKTNPNDTELGFIAQEVEIIVPEIVDIDGKEGDEAVKGLKYIGFVPILVKAVQEMKLDYDVKIQELKTDYDAKLSNLEARLHALENTP